MVSTRGDENAGTTSLNDFTHESLQDAESIATYLKALQDGFAKGRIELTEGDATLIMDPFHILRGGGNLESIAKVPGEKVAIWHWNDVPDSQPINQQTDADRVLPGDGVGPLMQIERLARQQGYSGFVSLELFNPQLWERNPEEVARIGLDKMRAYFAN